MDRVKVLYDHQTFDTQVIGGISRYFFELISAYEKDETIECELSLMFSNNEYLKQHPYYQKNFSPKVAPVDFYKSFFRGVEFKGKHLLYKVKTKLFSEPISINSAEINKANSIQKIKEGNFDVFHPTYYDNYFLNYIGNKPFVLTVHDLIHQIFPEFGLYKDDLDKNKEMINRANKIITVSESTKKDLINIFNVPENKVEVIYLANSLQENTNIVTAEFKSKIPHRYLLYVGNRDFYKNFLFFTQIFSSLGSEAKDISVVCTGSPFNVDEKYALDKMNLNNRITSMYVNDAELSYLYKNAIALVFPSMYEGFGLPVLEAFSCGCPVLVSNSSSLKEIGNDAVIYFEPKNPSSMLEALKSVLSNKDLRTDKIKSGYIQLKNFSWSKTAEKTKKVYSNLKFN